MKWGHPSGEHDSIAEPWHINAVFYEVAVNAFYDASGDGIGDLQGLIGKLDYIQDLGVTCLWLLPLFESPRKDDGYDVSDYRAIHAPYGTLDDFRALLAAAHKRELRVVIDMPINHTSDEHPWFQASRRAPAGSPQRRYYHWSQTASEYRDAGVLFADHVSSNWTWDEQAQAFYWHRFYPHQPDLNYEAEEVREEMLDVMRFWAETGVDGISLTGAAYLAEQDGTRCEHLEETHAFLKLARATLAAHYPHLLLVAGVNAWPHQAARYFGEAGECQIVPQLALAQRVFQSLREENAYPLINLLEQTPAPPAGCQWLSLLRNHDELTLRCATDEERDYMYRAYAIQQGAQRHDGIMRRLAPMVDGHRAQIELLFGLLLSLPGAPLIYYGDELGMGDNLFLRGREGVRTPMPWSADRNAGFSSADFASLYAPPVMDPVYGHAAVNVAAQLRNAGSLLHAVRTRIALRQSNVALRRGSFEIAPSTNGKIFAFVRTMATDGAPAQQVLVVANLAASPQPVELDLAIYARLHPVELGSKTPFPQVASQPYSLTLAPYACMWFELVPAPSPVAVRLAPIDLERRDEAPALELADSETLFSDNARQQLEVRILPGFLRSQRWFGGKARAVASIRIEDWGSVTGVEGEAYLVLLRVKFAQGNEDTYFVPWVVLEGADASRIQEHRKQHVVARVVRSGSESLLVDGIVSQPLCLSLLEAVGRGAAFAMQCGEVICEPTHSFARLRGNQTDRIAAVPGPATSSNSLVFLGKRLLLKFFRRLEPGINPDYEIGRFLTDERQFPRIPQVAGKLEYRPGDGRPSSMLGIVQAMVANQGDGWQHAIDELGRYYQRALARSFDSHPLMTETRPVAELINQAPPLRVLEALGNYVHAAQTLGRRTAEMHLALAQSDDPAFSPEPLTTHDLEELTQNLATQTVDALVALESSLARLPQALRTDAAQLASEGPTHVANLASVFPAGLEVTRIRIHGDYHLGQVLWVENDYILLDFEGEPASSVEERRRKYSPLRDVAGMVRSYHYAAYAGLFAAASGRPRDFERLVPWAESWYRWISAAFLQEYLRTARGAHFLPPSREDFGRLLNTFMLAKAVYELKYELNNRPDWVRIPMSGLASLLGIAPGVGAAP